jgi:4-phytase/acid phosphatase/peptide/nickel transport system substrate-binding protein
MTPIHSRLLKIMLPLAAVAGFAATPALAQKKGGTLTVGVELDIAGFDPLKVGVYDTSPNIAASLFLEQLTRLGDDGKPKPSLASSWSALSA